MSSRFNPISSPPFQTMTPGTSMVERPVASPSFSSFQNDPGTSFLSPQPNTPGIHNSSPKQHIHPQSQTLALSCQSPDALSVHTLIRNNSSIQTQSLPLNHKSSRTIKTDLPKWLISSLKVDPPQELICIDNDTTTSSSLKRLFTKDQQQQRVTRKISLPLLCIYTTKAVYLIQIIVLPSPIADDEDPALIFFKGIIESIHEPLESYLQEQNQDNDYDFSIQRVRSAPYCHLNGGAMYNVSPFIPRGCMAILLSSAKSNQLYGNDDDIEESSYSQVLLYHGVDNENRDDAKNNIYESSKSHKNNISVSNVHTFRQVVDFCFLPSYTASAANTANKNNCTANSSSLWNGTSIALSTKDGDIYTMTPIVFHGMAVPKQLLIDAITNLKASITNTNNSNMANEKENRKSDSNVSALTTHDDSGSLLYRRNVATLAYIKDVFGIFDAEDEKQSSGNKRKVEPCIVTANIFNHSDKVRTAASWPIAIQGPIYTPSESCADEVCCMESLPSPPPSSLSLDDEVCFATGYTSSLILARGKHGRCVQYVMIPSGINCVPRFLFESGNDCEKLNGLIENTGTLIEEIWLESDQEDHIVSNDSDEQNIQLAFLGNKKSNQEERGDHNIVIIVDPIDTSMVHHISDVAVVTITTNATKVMTHKLSQIVSKGKSIVEEIKTKVWSSIDILRHNEISIGACAKISGVSVSGDARLGHLLVAVLSDGKVEVVNLTALQYLNEASNGLEISMPAINAGDKSAEEKEADQALEAMEELPALHKQISPLLEKISNGLSGMSKMVGGSTKPRSVTPGAIAAFVSTKQTCEQDIVLPLRELHALISPHLPYMLSMHKHQLLQLQRLKGMMQKLEERIGATKKKLLLIEANHKEISWRSADILVTSRELTPVVTKAEKEYFKDVQRCEANCSKWEQQFAELQSRCKGLILGIESAHAQIRIKAELNDNQSEACKTLLEGQRAMLKDSEIAIREAEGQMKTIFKGSLK